MRTAAQRLVEAEVVTNDVRFVSQIDDGLVRFAVPMGENPVLKIKDELNKVYGAAGLKISWDKTYIDNEWSVFLNDVRCLSTPVFAGMRAFLKLNDRTDAVAPHIVDDTDLLESRARGSLVSGCRLWPVLLLVAFLFADTLRKWSISRLDAQKALWMFVPVALGGMGISNPICLSGSYTGRAVADGLGNLKRIAIRYRGLRQHCNTLVNTSPRERPQPRSISTIHSFQKRSRVRRGPSRSSCFGWFGTKERPPRF